MDLLTANKDIERKNLIDIYINEAIISLNTNTCIYTGSQADTNLCDQSVENGLRSLYSPFISNTPSILDTGLAKFTVGVYLDYYCTVPSHPTAAIYKEEWNQNVFILRDDFNIKNIFVSDMLENGTLINEGFAIQRHMLDSFKHRRFIHSQIEIGGKQYSLISAAVSDVCDSGSGGVLFIFSEVLNQVPPDLENVTTIFGRLFSNWLARYEECVRIRCIKKTDELRGSVTTPSEALELQKDKGQAKNNGTHSDLPGKEAGS
jgi:hypothetical protein